MNAPFLPGRGFRDPVLGSQSMFRAILNALSRPGTIVAIPEVGVEGSGQVSHDVLAILLALCDQDTPVWLDADLRGSHVARWLAFHGNCPVTDDPAKASFGLLRGRSDDPALADFAQGDPRYPDRSTTLIVMADALSGGEKLTLEGPGIEHQIRIAPVGLPQGFVEAARDNHTLYPLGLDFLLVAGHAMAGLPRTTRIMTEAH
jgi:alpha-D-ribose 1-methylphosphonate 5-triphosphate synthase subunit PhnH